LCAARSVTACPCQAGRYRLFIQSNVNRSPRHTAATREAPAAVWRGLAGSLGDFSHLK